MANKVNFSSGSRKPGHADRPIEKLSSGLYRCIGADGQTQYQIRTTLSFDIEIYPQLVEHILKEVANGEIVSSIVRRLMQIGLRALTKGEKETGVKTIDQQLFYPMGLPVSDDEEEQNGIPENWQPPDVSMEI